MRIRRSTESDVERIMQIYAHARAFMAATGNPRQWGPTQWPPEELIHRDIANGTGYVCEHDGAVVGVFYYAAGRDIEPTYAHIEDGAWIGGDTYGVVHRIASDGTVPGTGSFCINWAFEQCGHVRIDTHADNVVMLNLLRKLGFIHCGTIFVHEDNDPRLAFEKLS
ncbi:MAG: GNAT family N-acetyltransferase [Atopobiaceae bacterium]|nr:GNAT family N-acetyltransferase [Atopobiaceae bacterium]